VSTDAPVLVTLLRTSADVDVLATKIARHRPKPEGTPDARYLQVIAYWWQPGASLSQKNLARAWNGILAKIAGCTPGEMWASICGELLGYVDVVDPITRKTKTVYRSSTTIRTVAEWTGFNRGIERIALEIYDIPKLPDPKDPQAWAAFRGIKRVATDGE
jgi:hypothetical protein